MKGIKNYYKNNKKPVTCLTGTDFQALWLQTLTSLQDWVLLWHMTLLTTLAAIVKTYNLCFPLVSLGNEQNKITQRN